MSEKIYTWYKLFSSDSEINLSEHGIAEVEVNSKYICITKYNNTWYAFTNRCPHASGVLSDGYIDAIGNVVCPVHRYKFSLKNGRNTSGEGYYLKTFPVEQRDDGLYVGFEENSLFKKFFQ